MKIIYAHPSDVPDHVLDGPPGQRLADLIQQDVRTDAGLVAAAANQQRTIRLDLGTSCGIGYVDIASVALPRTAAEYAAGGDPNAAASRVETGGRAALSRSAVYPAMRSL